MSMELDDQGVVTGPIEVGRGGTHLDHGTALQEEGVTWLRDTS